MKKVGILSTFYNSLNYGGVLQAYAICCYLNSLGVSAEQICVDNTPFDLSKAKKNKNLKSKLRKELKKAYHFFIKMKKSILIFRIKRLRRNIFDEFCSFVPHSSAIYTRETIKQIDDIYDLIIVGSDRVWDMTNTDSIYFLKQTKKPHISYAASLFSNIIPEHYYSDVKNTLKDFSFVSVRESLSKDVLAEICQRKIEWVLDPVFLLNQTTWKSFSQGALYHKKYVFVYLLGVEKEYRKIIQEYAKIRNLSIITIPFANNVFNIYDIWFGDIKRADCAPNEFVALIQNAECVFTDSFHATAFSVIMEKQFFCFLRKDKKEMGTRIQSLLDLINARNRFCDEEKKANLNYILSTPDIDYQKSNDDLEQMVNNSKQYINLAANRFCE